MPHGSECAVSCMVLLVTTSAGDNLKRLFFIAPSRDRRNRCSRLQPCRFHDFAQSASGKPETLRRSARDFEKRPAGTCRLRITHCKQRSPCTPCVTLICLRRAKLPVAFVRSRQFQLQTVAIVMAPRCPEVANLRCREPTHDHPFCSLPIIAPAPQRGLGETVENSGMNSESAIKRKKLQNSAVFRDQSGLIGMV